MNFQNCAIYCCECENYIYDLEFERIYKSEEEKFYQLLLQSQSSLSIILKFIRLYIYLKFIYFRIEKINLFMYVFYSIRSKY